MWWAIPRSLSAIDQLQNFLKLAVKAESAVPHKMEKSLPWSEEVTLDCLPVTMLSLCKCQGKKVQATLRRHCSLEAEWCPLCQPQPAELLLLQGVTWSAEGRRNMRSFPKSSVSPQILRVWGNTALMNWKPPSWMCHFGIRTFKESVLGGRVGMGKAQGKESGGFKRSESQRHLHFHVARLHGEHWAFLLRTKISTY